MGDTATLTREVTFRSKCHNLRLVRVNDTEIPAVVPGEKGRPIPGLRYEFKEFRLVVDQETLDRDEQYFRDRAETLGREYEGPAGTLEWLRSHPELGSSFYEVELKDMAPPPDEALARVIDMASDLDVDGLEKLLEEERETYQRDVVLVNAERALERSRAIRNAEPPEASPPEAPPAEG